MTEQKILDVQVPQTVAVDKLLQYYREMLLIRRFEEKASQLYGMGKIAGFCHLYIGQEAVVVGIQNALHKDDTVITAYRDHGHMLACGMDPNGVMAELTGRIDGYSKGKGGSMHMFSRSKNFMGGHGIVGANVSLGTGIALAHQYNTSGAISVTYMGDGAINQGQVYESFNMAALWKLPVLYIIENNGYSMGTAAHRGCALSDQLYNRGCAHGIPGLAVNGMNVVEVNAAAKAAAEYVRSGKGPFILEMQTYRYRGHSMSDPATYRPKEEVDDYKTTKDPILGVKEWLKAQNVEDSTLKDIDKEIKKVVKDSAEFSLESPEPEASELYTDILRESSQ